jgi:hypothetical protein
MNVFLILLFAFAIVFESSQQLDESIPLLSHFLEVILQLAHRDLYYC